jgi:hypothetical protein
MVIILHTHIIYPLVIKVKSCPGSLAIMSRWNFDSRYIRKINIASRLYLYVSQKPVAGNSKFKFWHVSKIEFYQIKNLHVRIQLKSTQNFRKKFMRRAHVGVQNYVFSIFYMFCDVFKFFFCTSSTLKTVLRMNLKKKIKFRGLVKCFC